MKCMAVPANCTNKKVQVVLGREALKTHCTAGVVEFLALNRAIIRLS